MASSSHRSAWWNFVAGGLQPQSKHNLCRYKKLLYSILGFLTTVGTLYLLYLFIYPQLIRFRFRSDLGWYDLGLYGFSPSRSYFSFDYVSPDVEILQSDSQCEKSFVFLAPRGDSIAQPGPMILSSDGELVWVQELHAITQDFGVQRYNGEDYLTYWAGDEVDGHGQGSWHMLDSSYTERYIVSAAGDHLKGDLHDFQITENGTALVTIYELIPFDLTSLGGPKSGWLFDGIFQELDIATGQLIFEWHASQHFPINSSFLEFNGMGYDPENAFDFFHINSIDKDPWGNYLVSGRHTHTISSINSITGDVLWTIGGRSNDFTDVSRGAATNFSWQHDARWHGNNTITLFDNSAHGQLDPAPQSRGMAIEVDVPGRKALLLASYYHPQELKSPSQGNLQILEDSGNAFVGWGHSAAFSEFRADGVLLCDMHFGASAYFMFGRAVSYRVYKSPWVAKPHTRPDTCIVDNDKVYVSWNGATEVATWQLEVEVVLGSNDTRFEVAAQQIKTGFETEILIPPDINQSHRLRVKALDAQGQTLEVTDILERDSSSWDDSQNLFWWAMTSVLGIGLICLLVSVIWRFRNYSKALVARRFLSPRGGYQPVSLEEVSVDNGWN